MSIAACTIIIKKGPKKGTACGKPKCRHVKKERVDKKEGVDTLNAELCLATFKSGPKKGEMCGQRNCKRHTIQAPHSEPTSVHGRIHSFFTKTKRGENDAANKTRESVLVEISEKNPFPDDPQWCMLHTAFHDAVKRIATVAHVSSYTSIRMTHKGGRGFHYDFELCFYQNQDCVATCFIEFKHGADSVNQLPQILSVTTSSLGGFLEPYESFYYTNFLDEYIETDKGITCAKPSWEHYNKCVKNVSETEPFFVQLKEREHVEKLAKKRIVNKSITAYLEKYGRTSSVVHLQKKLESTQAGKIYLFWKNNTFHVQHIPVQITSFQLDCIHNGNTLVYKSQNMSFHALLRWRNHSGILNPAWQIKMKSKVN